MPDEAPSHYESSVPSMPAPDCWPKAPPHALSFTDAAHSTNQSAGELARPPLGTKPIAMETRERATSVWYRIAGLISRKQEDPAIDIIEGEIRAAQHDAFLEAERLVVSGFGAQPIAKELRDRAERRVSVTACLRGANAADGPRWRQEQRRVARGCQALGLPADRRARWPGAHVIGSL